MSRIQEIAINETGFAFDPQTGDCYRLNETAGFLFHLLKQGLDLKEIAAHFSQKFGIDRTLALEDTQDFLQQLKSYGLAL